MKSRLVAQAQSAHLRKACFSCIRAKRRCDKSLPSCQRCIEKEVLCKYPSTRPYTRRGTRPPAPELPCEQAVALVSEQAVPPVSAPTTQVSWNSESFRSYWEQGETELNGDNSIITPPMLVKPRWFLQGDSWSIHEYELEDVQLNIGASHWKGYAKCVRRWLQQWVVDNHCPFIHRQLYVKIGLPACLQDAYASLAAYTSKTEKNEDLVMQLVEDKANALLRQHESSQLFPLTGSYETPTPVPIVNTFDHLARVQALFIYQFIRLFDGDIRHRAQAERHSATLQEWKTQLWESAKLNAYVQDTLGDSGLSTTQWHGALEPIAQFWHEWILAESVRRTWMVVTYTDAVYLTLRDGQAVCPGSIAYTLRRSLWGAVSATEWYWLVNNENPLFMRSDPPKMLLAKASPREVDEFGLSIASIMWDSRSIDSWFAKAPDTNLQELLQGNI
ncbi:hypothetical protein HD806DRAFT_552122 [Xylariaceae sp. AK1471]|nr:hypothetical protein HD806DRAFT_552122 [Xylariaceae sp. AK1471]